MITIIENIGKILANVGTLVYFKVYEITLSIQDRIDPISLNMGPQEEKHIEQEDTNKSNYIPYNGPYCETP